MKTLYFLIFFSAILFSEVVTHVISWEEGIVMENEMPSDESNDSENEKEGKEDQVEEDKLFSDINPDLYSFISSLILLPCSYNTLLHQSLKEIDLPPPDLV